MKIAIDENRFDRLQMQLLWEIIDSSYRAFVRAGISQQKIPDLILDSVFSICCAIDGSTAMQDADGPIHPILTFAKDTENAEVVSAGHSSWMHEYVHGVVEEYLQEKM